MIALCLIRDLPHYRRAAFVNGLQRAGYRLVNSGRPAGPEDLLIIWNRYGSAEAMAESWEREGGTVLVCENGYVGRDPLGRQYYAIAAHGHNGSGWWPVGTEDRWSLLGIELKPWRETTPDSHLLICGQRGIGSRLMASPQGWDANVAQRLKKITNRPISIRPHPGNQPAKTTLEADLDGALACVIWSSSSGVKALIAGYRVFYDAPHWICESAVTRARSYAEPADYCSTELRSAALGRMAWAQWSVAEIESGEPFVRLRDEAMRRAGEKEAA